MMQLKLKNFTRRRHFLKRCYSFNHVFGLFSFIQFRLLVEATNHAPRRYINIYLWPRFDQPGKSKVAITPSVISKYFFIPLKCPHGSHMSNLHFPKYEDVLLLSYIWLNRAQLQHISATCVIIRVDISCCLGTKCSTVFAGLLLNRPICLIYIVHWVLELFPCSFFP